MHLTWQWEKNSKFAYCGSLRNGGHSGRPGICCRAARQNMADVRLMSNERKSFDVRAKLSRSRGCMRLNI